MHNCYCYEEAGHLIKDCLHHLNIRQLMVKQREELIKDLMALKDAIITEETKPLLEEDFV